MARQLTVTSDAEAIEIKDEFGRELGTLYISPSDMNMPNRIQESYTEIQKILEEAAGIKIGSTENWQTDPAFQELRKVGDKVISLFNYMFNANYKDIFGDLNPLTPLKNGQFQIENLLEGLLPIVAEIFKENTEAAEKHYSDFKKRHQK